MSASAEAREVLAPTGRLRIALGKDAALRGVGHDLAGELARELRVPIEPLVFECNSEVIDAVKAARVDVVFANASPERMKEIDFSQPYLRIGLGYLARAGSPVAKVEDADRPGVFVAVLAGGTSDSVLSKSLREAQIVRARSVAEGVELLRSGQADLLATRKSALFEAGGQVPGSRVLEGNWGIENHAIGIPKGRERALPFLREFVEDAVKRGVVRDAVQRAGLRGTL